MYVARSIQGHQRGARSVNNEPNARATTSTRPCFRGICLSSAASFWIRLFDPFLAFTHCNRWRFTRTWHMGTSTRASCEFINGNTSSSDGIFTSTREWAKRMPNVSFCRPLGKITFSRGWMKSRSKVSCCRALGKVAVGARRSQIDR